MLDKVNKKRLPTVRTREMIQVSKTRLARFIMCERAAMVQAEWDKHAANIGVTITMRGLYEDCIKPMFKISIATFNNYINLDFSKELDLMKNPLHYPSEKWAKNDRKRVYTFPKTNKPLRTLNDAENRELHKLLTVEKPHSTFTNEEARAYLRKIRKKCRQYDKEKDEKTAKTDKDAQM